MRTTSELLTDINQRHGTAFALLDRYATGEQGGYALADASGDRFVLKWAADGSVLTRYQRAQHITDRLRALGYPAPQHVLVGELAATRMVGAA